jgi:methyl-accepting chemotaxis protein
MARHKGKLLVQLTVSLGLAIIFLSLASFYYQFLVEKHILMDKIRDDLRRQATLLCTWLEHAETRGQRQAIAEQYVDTIDRLGPERQTVVIVDGTGAILASNTGDYGPGEKYPSPLLGAVLEPEAPADGKAVELARKHVVAFPCYAGPAKRTIVGAVLLEQPLTSVARLVDSLMLGAFVLLAVTLVIIVAVVHVVLRLKVHKPMQAIFMQEYRIREGDLAKIDAEDPANEFSDLYGMYNEMVVRIAAQKRAILEQKDHAATAQLVRQAVNRLTGPLDEIAAQSRRLLEHESSLSDDDRASLKQIIGNVTRIARELKSILVEGDRSAAWLRRESEKLPRFQDAPEPESGGGRHVIE